VISFHKSVTCLVTLIILSCLSLPAYSQEEIRVRIGSSGRGEVTLGVEPFSIAPGSRGLDQHQLVVYSILVNDLRFSLRFKVAELDERLRFKTAKERPRLVEERAKAWLEAGVDVFVRGEISGTSQEFQITCALEGPAGSAPIMTRTYQARRSDLRTVVHRLSDEIIFAVTGEQGISQTKIAFISKRTGNKELYMADYDGFNEVQLTRNGSITLSPAWSPFGDEIVFTSFQEGKPDLYMLDIAKRTVREYLSYPGMNSAAAWSPDGKEIAVTLSKDGNPEIYVIDFWTGKMRRLTYSSGIDTSPSWSPTGKEIAFVSDRAGTPAIYVMGADGSNVRRLTFVGKYNAAPSWSPLGDRVAFVGRSIDEGNTDLYIVEVASGSVSRISAIGDNLDPSWSPEGYHVAFTSNRDGPYDIYTLTWDGADLRRLTYSGQNYTPAWSPVTVTGSKESGKRSNAERR
jgi:TolB protein